MDARLPKSSPWNLASRMDVKRPTCPACTARVLYCTCDVLHVRCTARVPPDARYYIAVRAVAAHGRPAPLSELQKVRLCCVSVPKRRRCLHMPARVCACMFAFVYGGGGTFATPPTPLFVLSNFAAAIARPHRANRRHTAQTATPATQPRFGCAVAAAAERRFWLQRRSSGCNGERGAARAVCVKSSCRRRLRVRVTRCPSHPPTRPRIHTHTLSLRYVFLVLFKTHIHTSHTLSLRFAFIVLLNITTRRAGVSPDGGPGADVAQHTRPVASVTGHTSRRGAFRRRLCRNGGGGGGARGRGRGRSYA